MNKWFITLVSLCFITLSCVTKNAEVKEEIINPFLGSWNINEVHWITPDTTYSIHKAQPGIFMVSPKRYSIIWTPKLTPREPFKKLSYPTEEEMIAGFRSIVFNSGTYTYNNTTFNIEALIAKVPGFEGGKQIFNYKIESDKLELKMVDETYPSGEKPDWIGSLETLFIMTRIDSIN